MERPPKALTISDLTDRIARFQAKPGAPVLDAGEIHAYLERAGVVIGENGVTTHADGSVTVDAVHTKALGAAWAAFEPLKKLK